MLVSISWTLGAAFQSAEEKFSRETALPKSTQVGRLGVRELCALWLCYWTHFVGKAIVRVLLWVHAWVCASVRARMHTCVPECWNVWSKVDQVLASAKLRHS